MHTLATSGLIVIQSRRILLAFSGNKKAWYLPGGKIEQGETPIQALIREIKEELNLSIEGGDIRFYTHISAIAFGEAEQTRMEQDCFLYLNNDVFSPAGEIESIRYFDRAGYALESKQVPGVLIVMEKLKKDDLID
jgi:8-oxo-dGTP pyrophosphatase MutT (NUDIX family)